VSASYDNVEQWSETFRRDASEHHRFATRFILVQGLAAWKETIDFLKIEIGRHIRLSDLCSDDDTVPYLNIDKIKKMLVSYENTSVLIYPLAECLRFLRGGAQLLSQLAQLELRPNLRVYVPLFEADDIFSQGVGSLARYRAGELAPSWTINGSGEVRLQAAEHTFYDKGSVIVDGFKAYLQQWEQGGASSILLITRLFESCSPAVGRLEIIVYKDTFDILASRLTNLLEKSWGTKNQWGWLLSRLKNEQSVQELAAKMFNAVEFQSLKLLADWKKLDDNSKWLAWLWGKTAENQGDLLVSVIQRSQSPESLVKDLYNIVFCDELTFKQLRDRRDLLRLVAGPIPPKPFVNNLSPLKSPLSKLKALTGITTDERLLALSYTAELISERSDSALWLPHLETVFPELSHYLKYVSLGDEFAESYFNSFTKARVLNCLTDELKMLGEQAAKNEHYYKYVTRLSYLEKYVERDKSVIWFDGLGLEWLGLIKGVASEYRDVKISFQPVRSNLPSITETNWGAEKEAYAYRNLDQTAHSYDYAFPNSFHQEIEYVTSSFRKIIEGMHPDEVIVITSDHGLTPASFNKETIKGLSDVKPLHWGRDAEYDTNASHLVVNSGVFINDGNRLFLATHGRLYGGAPFGDGQLHGGATLEEALVPIITLSKIQASRDSAEVKPPKIIQKKVKLDPHGNCVIKLRVFGNPISVHIRIGLSRFEGRWISKDTWEINLKGIASGKINASVDQEGVYVGTIEFETTRGIKEVELGL